MFFCVLFVLVHTIVVIIQYWHGLVRVNMEDSYNSDGGSVER